MTGDKPAKQKFKAYPIGYFHVDIAEVRTEQGKLHLYVGIDRTSKFAFAQLHPKADRPTAVAFLEAPLEAVPYDLHAILTDNGIQFADLPRNRDGWTARLRPHSFDQICAEHGIGHRLTKPNHPWTNGQAERMNRTIEAFAWPPGTVPRLPEFSRARSAIIGHRPRWNARRAGVMLPHTGVESAEPGPAADGSSARKLLREVAAPGCAFGRQLAAAHHPASILIGPRCMKAGASWCQVTENVPGSTGHMRKTPR